MRNRMGTERRIGAALGMGSEKSMFFIKPGPACPSDSPAGPSSIPGMAGGRSYIQPGLVQPSSIPGQKSHSLHNLRWGLFWGKLFPTFLQISKDSQALKPIPADSVSRASSSLLPPGGHISSFLLPALNPYFMLATLLRLGTPRGGIPALSSQAPGLVECPQRPIPVPHRQLGEITFAKIYGETLMLMLSIWR